MDVISIANLEFQVLVKLAAASKYAEHRSLSTSVLKHYQVHITLGDLLS